MNIKQAKEQIKNAMTAYFTKDKFGNYIIPIERQRPIFLMGAPGIGKTAIMEQVAAELGVGLVSYSMTHHTRQSALGLPFIETKTYGGKEYSVSEYTMSEIIASVYDMMESSGVKEGILFLDEINCVSETLAPSMLQFLQYKIFGRHRVPDGWIVVTAGNPPEYNNSVREFDIVTWDRLKRIDVEAEYETWKEYAYRKGVHPAIITYLDIKKADFYKIETTVDGKSFVTARGWTDLSDMIGLYEQHSLPVNEILISQYLQNKKIAKSFAVYYDLWCKYRSDYQVDKILSGKATDELVNRAKNAKFDERLSLIGLMLDAISAQCRDIYCAEQTHIELLSALKQVKIVLSRPGSDPVSAMQGCAAAIEKRLEQGKISSSVSKEQENVLLATLEDISEISHALAESSVTDGAEAFKFIKKIFDKKTAEIKKTAQNTGKELSNMFKFCEAAFNEGQEMLIIVTELTINFHTAHFISRYGCDEYFKHNKELLLYERQKEIITELDSFELD